MGERKKKGEVGHVTRKTKKKGDKKRRREGEKEENETVSVRRRCSGPVSVETSEISSQ